MKRLRKQTRPLAGNAAILLFLILAGLFMLLPLIYTVVNAFKPLNEIFLFPPRFFVRHPTLDNFILMLQLASNFNVPFSRYVFNSVFVAGAGTLLYILIVSLAAYPLA